MFRLFTRHPREVGETYFEHFIAASSFGLAMAYGALACLLHAVLPFLCKRTGSMIVARLNARMAPRSRHVEQRR